MEPFCTLRHEKGREVVKGSPGEGAEVACPRKIGAAVEQGFGLFPVVYTARASKA